MSEITMLSDDRQLVWTVSHGDGCECKDLLGVFGTEGEARKAAEHIEALVRANWDKSMRSRHGEWRGYIAVDRLFMNAYELPADALCL
jgi:hypothetical protein